MNTDSMIESSKAEKTVLLIDDDEVVADVGEQMLKSFGYGVVKANSGSGAIEVYRENQDRIGPTGI